MSQTTNYTFVKPTVGGDLDSWGDELNEDLDLLDAYFSGPDSKKEKPLKPILKKGEWKIGDGEATGELIAITPSGEEFNYLTGVTSNLQTQLDGKQTENTNLTDISNIDVEKGIIAVGSGDATPYKFVGKKGVDAIHEIGVPTVTEAEAEAGTGTVERLWTPERVSKTADTEIKKIKSKRACFSYEDGTTSPGIRLTTPKLWVQIPIGVTNYTTAGITRNNAEITLEEGTYYIDMYTSVYYHYDITIALRKKSPTPIEGIGYAMMTNSKNSVDNPKFAANLIYLHAKYTATEETMFDCVATMSKIKDIGCYIGAGRGYCYEVTDAAYATNTRNSILAQIKIEKVQD